MITDADVVDAFLVADLALRYGQFPNGDVTRCVTAPGCYWGTAYLVHDLRMPQNVGAVGTRYGSITIEEIRHG